jgi:hypothetical protein
MKISKTKLIEMIEGAINNALILEEEDNFSKPMEYFTDIIADLRANVFPKLNSTELRTFGRLMYDFFKDYK